MVPAEKGTSKVIIKTNDYQKIGDMLDLATYRRLGRETTEVVLKGPLLWLDNLPWHPT